MALNHILNSGHLLQSINVLRVVPQQLALPLYSPDELVAWRGLELTRVNLSGKLEERPGVLPTAYICLHR